MRRSNRRGLTLIEVLVAVGILSMIATLVYGAFDGMARSQTGLEKNSERFHQGRSALNRMARELESAFLSFHKPLLDQRLQTSQTAFVGTDSGKQDRLDFTSFSHRRLGFGAHESDQNELSYFLSPDPDTKDLDLARRESSYIDMDPKKGGTVQVIAYGAESLDFQYLDPVIGEWVDSWDSTQPTGQLDRMPLQVRIELTVSGAEGGAPLHYVTKVPLAMQTPLSFGVPR